MGKKKREHVVFDQMLKPKKSIPFSIVNKETTQKQNKKVRYWSRDEIENIVKEKNINRSRFYEYSKSEYEKVIRKFYYAFCDNEKYPKIELPYAWLRFRENLTAGEPIRASAGWANMLQGIKHEMNYDWSRKLYLILNDGWVYQGYIDEIITVLEDITGNIEDFYIVSLEFDCMASYCGDGDCVVIYSN